MIVPHHLKGQTVGVFGLARSGRATMLALKEAGAKAIGFDDRDVVLNEGNTARWQDTDFTGLDRLVLSPGIPLTGPNRHKVVDKAAKAKVPVCGDFDLFIDSRKSLPSHKLVGITGTNGKSTTTALITHLVRENGHESVAFGNIGRPFLSVEPLNTGGVYVAELSSFQLDLSPAPSVNIAVLLNITPDHLDRHGTMDAYIAAKAKLFKVRKSKLIPVICVDNPFCRAIARDAGPYIVPISVKGFLPSGVWVANGQLVDGIGNKATIIGPMDAMPQLQGEHNWQNALAAYAVGRRLGFSAQGCFEALKTFGGLAHRQETLKLDLPFKVVNDSKATNWDSTARGLATYRSVRWIAGGRLKGEPPQIKAEQLGGVVKAYLYGEAGKVFSKLLPAGLAKSFTSPFSEAVNEALEEAEPGDTVLLSPAATAFDQFPDFEKRGDAFKSLADLHASGKVHEGLT